MAASLTVTEREAKRQKLREHALAHALDHHVTPLCRGHIARGTSDAEHGCSGKWGCLCTCHDPAPA